MMNATPRNAPCPCGSGLKYKRCCFVAERGEREATRFENAVGNRILSWVMDRFSDEIDAAVEDFANPAQKMGEYEFQVVTTWLCSDREVAAGSTPAERYAARADIDSREREVATRIAAAGLSLRRVSAVKAGQWIELESLMDGTVVRARSQGVSSEVIRWDVLLCRVMGGQTPSLWGPVVVFEPAEEPELVAEFERLASKHGLQTDAEFPHLARAAALEMVRFVPPSRLTKPSYFTPEGDPIVDGQANWRVTDADAVFELMDHPPELAWVGESDDGLGETFQWTADRASLLAGSRRSLPAGALCFESGLTELPGRLCLATFVLGGGWLRCTTMSEARLDAAVRLVDERVGALAELRDRSVLPIDGARPSERIPASSQLEPPPGLTAAEVGELEREALDQHFRAWLDRPLAVLGGRTPRQAAREGPCDELELLLRGIENRAERARRTGVSWPELGWLRVELGLRVNRLAA